jgi:phosphatidylglycerophosphate synthase
MPSCILCWPKWRFSDQPEDRWNRDVRLILTDRLFARTLEPLLPRWLKPNHFTLFRLYFFPLPVILLGLGLPAPAVVVFLLLGLTDHFDGALARVRRQITEWGVVHDSVADKLLVGSMLLAIIVRHAGLAVAALLIAAEVASILVAWRDRCRGMIKPANFWGKAKMVLEVVGVSLLLIASWPATGFLAAVGLVTLFYAAVAAIMSVVWRLRF